MNEARVYAVGILVIALTGATGMYLVAGGPSAHTESLPEITAATPRCDAYSPERSRTAPGEQTCL